MESDGLQLQYLRQQVEKGIRDIFTAQRMIASKRLYQKGHERTLFQGQGNAVRGRSGALMAALTNPQYRIGNSGGGLEATSTVPLRIRFLDMKKYGNFQIYNRQVWGILYSETLQNIKYGYRDWIRTHFPEMLKEISDKIT